MRKQVILHLKQLFLQNKIVASRASQTGKDRYACPTATAPSGKSPTARGSVRILCLQRGILQPEFEKYIRKTENILREFLDNNNLVASQQQFDALVRQGLVPRRERDRIIFLYGLYINKDALKPEDIFLEGTE